ncbi:MAG: hypothetical protein MI784_06440, partial [Cytophagales bacterium]|nr:hypothetical protein [Cytophagales bacterium]
LYFAPDKWFVYVGKPDAPVKLAVLGVFTSESYFMVGDEIPEPPAPPRKLMEILKEGQEVSKRDDKGLAAGRGFAFGVRAAFDSKTKFLIFYGEFSFGMGFDLMIKKYADDALCNGNSDFGIDHWYAQGQAYVYISAKIGIEVTVLLKDINVVIIEASFGVLLQIRGPNPFYFRGIVSGDFSVLGGMVTGSCKFKLTVGEACEFSESSSPLDDIQVIAELTPRDGSKEVDVFTSPQAVFNMSIDKEFTIPNYEESGPADFYFRIKVDQLRLVDKNGREVDGEVEWNEDHTVAAFKPHEILPPKAAYTFKVKLLFEERKGWNWILVPDAKEEKQIAAQEARLKKARKQGNDTRQLERRLTQLQRQLDQLQPPAPAENTDVAEDQVAKY